MSRDAMQSDYMHWAKHQQPVRYRLSSSEVPHFRLDSLPFAIADLDLDGASHHRFAPLLDAIAARYGVSPDGIVTADGTSMANFLAMATLIAPGDEVAFEQPAYEPMLAVARFLGADIRRIERRPEDDFRLDPERLEPILTDRTRLIVLANLHNPSGALADEADLRAIGALAEARGARVLVDEVYLDSAVPPRRTAALLGPQFLVTGSLTKVYGLSGLRCGWILAEPALARRMSRLNDLFGVTQPHAAETLACIAFANLDTIVGDTPARLARNRALFDAFVTGRDDLDCMPAAHGITAFPRWAGGDTERLDALLRARYDTSIVPGRWFEMPDRFRIGLGCATDTLDERLSRLAAALDTLR